MPGRAASQQACRRARASLTCVPAGQGLGQQLALTEPVISVAEVTHKEDQLRVGGFQVLKHHTRVVRQPRICTMANTEPLWALYYDTACWSAV